MNTAASPSARIATPVPRSWWAYAAPMLVTAGLLALTFPRVGWWWLAFVALAPAAWVAVTARRSGRLLILGYAVFLAWWLLQVRWLMSVGVGPWLGVSLLDAAFFAGGLWAIMLLRQRVRLPITLAVGLAWVTMDLTRSYLPFGGFSWFSLGHTQGGFTDGGGASWIAQTADVFGEHFVGLLIALVNGALVELVLRQRKALRSVVPVAVLLVLAMGYGYWRVAQTAGVTVPGPRLAVVQLNIPLDNRRPYTLEEDVRRWSDLVSLSIVAAQEGVDLIIWPESSVPVPVNDEAVGRHDDQGEAWWEPRATRRKLSDVARRLGTDLLVGGSAQFDFKSYVDDQGRDFEMPGRRRNRIYHVYADGQFAPTYYDKMHLVPFGEYIPGSLWIPWIKTVVIDTFSPWDWDHTVEPGNRLTRFTVPYVDESGGPASVVVTTPVCFEDTVARICRRLVYASGPGKADVLINQTNDGWFWTGTRRAVSAEHPEGTEFYPTAQNIQHLQIASIRSIENRVPTARAVNTGISGFIDSAGRVGPLVTEQGEQQMVAGVAVHRVGLDPRVPMYARWGDVPMWLLGGATYLLLSFALVRPWLLGR